MYLVGKACAVGFFKEVGDELEYVVGFVLFDEADGSKSVGLGLGAVGMGVGVEESDAA